MLKVKEPPMWTEPYKGLFHSITTFSLSKRFCAVKFLKEKEFNKNFKFLLN